MLPYHTLKGSRLLLQSLFNVYTLKGSRSLLPSLFEVCGNPHATLLHFEGVEVTFA